MAVVLSKGGTVSLTKEAGSAGLASVTVGLGWDAAAADVMFDLDASALVVDTSGRVLSDAHFVFYNNLSSPEGGVRSGGDNRTGEGDGDDEQLYVRLTELPPNAAAVRFVVSIDQAAERGQHFGLVNNAYIRVVNDADGRELARFDLSQGAYGETALVFGEVYRDAGEWKFRAIGDGNPQGFAGILVAHGVNVG